MPGDTNHAAAVARSAEAPGPAPRPRAPGRSRGAAPGDLRERVRARLLASLPPLDARLRRRAVDAVTDQLLASALARDTPAALAFALARAVDLRLSAVRDLEREQAALLAALRAAPDERQRRAVLAAHLRRTRGAREAARARRFDVEAVQENFTARLADLVDEVCVAQRAFGACVAEAEPTIAAALKTAGVADALLDHAGPSRRPVVRAGALRALAGVLERVPPAERPSFLSPDAAYRVLAWASGDGAARWVQVGALEVSALLFADDLGRLARARLAHRAGRDGAVVRANVLRLLARASPPGALDVALVARDDPSEHVRQSLASALLALGGPAALEALVRLITDDPSERVAGFALRALAARARDDARARPVALLALTRAAAGAGRPLVARVALAALRALAAAGVPFDARAAVGALVELAGDTRSGPALVDEAAATLHWLGVQADPALRAARDALAATLARLPEGGTGRLPVPPGLDEHALERALGAGCRGDLSVAVDRAGRGALRLWRGEPRRLRAWRVLHELRHPMPDKRKAHVHTRGRVAVGDTVFAPVGMAEVTPTRVPGERHLHPSVGGWGPFVPRVDDLLAVCGWRRRSLRVVSALGALTVQSPPSWLARRRARRRLTLHYADFARARDRSLDAAEPAERRHFAELVAGLGVQCAFEPARGHVAGVPYEVPAWLPARYLAARPHAAAFGLALALAPDRVAALTERWPDLASFVSYALTPAGNGALQLAWLAWLVFAGAVLRAAWLQHDIDRDRARIPLSIGGWGTRGKSGTERLKAALFHALRYDVVVKTTGCEAMFIHAMRDVPAQEIFLYRPYDKATIWEQRNVLKTASNLRAQVFLWECMALQPRLVETLENEWMRDRITTLTNAYPDHEDIQGPSGEDVARVIGRFMPRGGVTFTTEEQMLPLLTEAARDKGTDLRPVDPLEADLLPADLLARFPYEEHPRNIALVLALGEHLGVDREFALVEMADAIVPDLGVLKTYPDVAYRGRTLSFSNGMSANERAGFLSNWTRLGFDRPAAPGDYVVLVVNNRADRVARSRVFAHILTDDVTADAIVFINTNLDGMLQFTREALELRLAELNLAGTPDQAIERLDRALLALGVPPTRAALAERLARLVAPLAADPERARALVEAHPLAAAVGHPSGDLGAALEAALGAALGPPDDADPLGPTSSRARADAVAHARRLQARFVEGHAAREHAAAALARGDVAAAEATFRDVYRSLFLARIAVLWDAHASGDQVIDFVTDQVPPGFRARVLGCQNIKGAGLDFVYRWLSVERVRAALERMRDEPEARAEQLAWLTSYADLGLLDCREAVAALRAWRAAGGDWDEHASALDVALARLEGLERELTAGLTAADSGGALERAAGFVERFVDHLDSVRRGSFARRVMADLYAGRTGHGRAARLMREVTSRSKGGWLYQQIKHTLSRSPDSKPDV